MWIVAANTLCDDDAEFLTLSENDCWLSLVARPWQRPSLNLSHCTIQDHRLGATIVWGLSQGGRRTWRATVLQSSAPNLINPNRYQLVKSVHVLIELVITTCELRVFRELRLVPPDHCTSRGTREKSLSKKSYPPFSYAPWCFARTMGGTSVTM